MIDYLILSAELTLVALVALACLRSAPASWRLRAALAALFVTTLPWVLVPAIPVPVISDSTTVIDVLPLTIPFSTPELAAPLASGSLSRDGWEIPLALVGLTASGLGAAAFTWLAVRQRSKVRRWRNVASDGDYLLDQMPEPVRRDCQIRVLPGSAEAVATGILRPTIWIGEHHVNDERCTSVLLHELMHLQRRHPPIVVALTFVRCLLWWQPFVWLWVWLARRELEYDCDEACADLLGHDPYRRTLASLIRDANPQPGLALMGRRSFNLGRVRSLEKIKVLRLRHRLATVVAICLVPLLALDFLAQAGDGNATTRRAELVDRVEGAVEAVRGASVYKIESVDGLIGLHFNTTLVDALRDLANGASRPVYLHPDVDASHEINVTVAGTPEEVIRAVAEHAGLAASANPTGFVVAEERLLAEPDWIHRAVVLSGVPNKRVRLDIDLEVDGETIPTPVDLIVGRSNWTGLEAGGCRINLVARRIDDDGVYIDLLSHLGSAGKAWHLSKYVPFGHEQALIDGSVWDTDGKLRQMVLRASAYEVDWGRDPFPDDAESS